MTTHDIRQKYLDFFKSKGHEVLPSASLLPENDPTTLFTGSGMQPMVPYLLGEKHPKGTRLTDSQKCFRAQDIEEVGDNRHTTFFEMLGNWSLGDYFKEEQISYIFEFLIKKLELDPHHLYVTCFRGSDELGIPPDIEAAELWKKQFTSVNMEAKVVDFPERDGMQGGRIFYYDEKKNWWSRAGVPQNMPVGEPGGPDTEMFWDFAPNRGNMHLRDEDEKIFGTFCHVNCDCGRFLEIGNNVFMQYRKTNREPHPNPLLIGEGTVLSSQQIFEPLPQKNVDFGGGLERMVAARNNNPDVFLIDIFTPMREVLERVSGKKYAENHEVTKAFRVILDHLRAAAFLIGDGVHPSNKDQGYFTRRLMRRAIRYASQLEIKDVFCAEVARAVVRSYAQVYPNLKQNETTIVLEMEKEEEKFRRTLAQGLKKFQEVTKGMEREVTIPGEQAFDLYQSYGFPLELTQELAKERELNVDVQTFMIEKEKHQGISRAGAEKKFHGGLADHSEKSVRGHTATHLLHAALRQILGEQVQQKGSNITPERIRFDFSHPAKLTEAEIKTVERLVNAAIVRDYPVTWREMPVAEAYKKNAIGFFPERYDEIVKVYTIGDPDQPMIADPAKPTFSQEICGGPHVEHTALVGKFTIVKEEALGAGMRRIKAVLE